MGATRWARFVLAAAGTLAGCTKTTTVTVTESVTVQQIVVVPDSMVLAPGDSVQLVVSALDAQGRLLTGIAITLTSSDTSTVTVSATGLVRAKKSGTTAHITVSGGGASTVVPVTVFTPIISRVLISGRPYDIGIGAVRTYVTTIGGLIPFNLATLAVGTPVPGAYSVLTDVTFNAAGTLAYASDQGLNRIAVINTSSNTTVDSIAASGSPVPMRVSGTSLFVTTNTNYLYRFNLGTKAATDSIALPATSHHLLMHPNDTTLYVATRSAGTVLEVNSRTMTLSRTFQVGGYTQAMALSPDLKTLYVADEDAHVYAISLASGTVTNSVALAGPAFGLAISPNGSRLYVGLYATGQVQVLNPATFSVARTVAVGGTPREIRYDAANQHVVEANESGWVDVLAP
jgi:YVTN family beta-propeller protein